LLSAAARSRSGHARLRTRAVREGQVLGLLRRHHEDRLVMAICLGIGMYRNARSHPVR